VPPTAFFSGNDVHQWCQRDKAMAQSYVAGLYDIPAHGATAIDNMRHWHKDLPNNDAEVDFALDRVVGYCKPDRATLEQVTCRSGWFAGTRLSGAMYENRPP
jgi:hypothetical protein